MRGRCSTAEAEVEVKVDDRRVGETANQKKTPERAFRIPARQVGSAIARSLSNLRRDVLPVL
jgi:hypothetical protein